MGKKKQATYEERVRALEAEGATTSDAQAAVDAEDVIVDRSRGKKDAATLPNRVRHYREATDLSPTELAAQIGPDWTASTVRRIERGARKPTPEQVARLATALGQPAATLFPDTPAAAPASKDKVIGKRTGKALATTDDVKDEIAAVLAG